jgi:hypothetical protein
MFGKNPELTPLELRKELLVAESELNRVQLIQEGEAMSGAVRTVAGRLKIFGSIASAGALVVTAVTALRRGRAAPAAGKTSWVSMALKGARLAGSLWLAMRARPK